MNYNLNELSIAELRALQLEITSTLNEKIPAQNKQDINEIREFIYNKIKNNPYLEAETAVEYDRNDDYIGLTWGALYKLS